MHYELYADSLFLLNFMMNLYLLILVDRSTLRTARVGRLTAGAAVGALCYFLPFLGTAPVFLKLTGGIIAGCAGMLCITFPVKSLRMFLRLLERLVLYSFGMGGALLFLIRIAGPAREAVTSVMGILGLGGLVFWLFLRFRYGLKAKDSVCRATLLRDGEEAVVWALIDSGNSLVEPISGKPVCILEQEVFDRIWKGDAKGFRAIPYHSIGKKSGILPGYLLPQLFLEIDGMKLSFIDVYIAVSCEEISEAKSADAESVKMIIHPGLLIQSNKGKPKNRQNVRRNDSESDDTGQNAV